jgi:hypothetical protein
MTRQILIPILFLAAAGCGKTDAIERQAEKVERGQRQAGEKARKLAGEAVEVGKKAGSEARTLGSKAVKEAEEVAEKAVDGARSLGQETGMAARQIGEKIQEKADSVGQAKKCKTAQENLRRCLPQLLANQSESGITAKCAAALVGGDAEAVKGVVCLHDAGTDCAAVSKCLVLPVWLKLLKR